MVTSTTEAITRPIRDDQAETQHRIIITYYTDPLCCWSWAFEDSWRRLLANYGNQITYSLVMGGMIPGWATYSDPLHSISRPAQMGPLWMYASQVTQTKMNYGIWAEDPPSSSYPPSLAVKTAGLQSQAAAEHYLHSLRRALMEEGINISRESVLLKVARNLRVDGFDFDRFVSDWRAGNGREAFRADLSKTKLHSIGRFPTLTLQNSEGTGVIIVGYRPYDALEEAFKYVLSFEEPVAGSLK
ncbi:MAG: DsbA family protein [Bacteroidota bacterium]|nr:MAG: disulfide bond formation protein DsbA [Bacteroidota bacterium]HLT73411.1 DsbA family protein [Cyclobacteriaceae bacterium]